MRVFFRPGVPVERLCSRISGIPIAGVGWASDGLLVGTCKKHCLPASLRASTHGPPPAGRSVPEAAAAAFRVGSSWMRSAPPFLVPAIRNGRNAVTDTACRDRYIAPFINSFTGIVGIRDDIVFREKHQDILLPDLAGPPVSSGLPSGVPPPIFFSTDTGRPPDKPRSRAPWSTGVPGVDPFRQLVRQPIPGERTRKDLQITSPHTGARVKRRARYYWKIPMGTPEKRGH